MVSPRTSLKLDGHQESCISSSPSRYSRERVIKHFGATNPLAQQHLMRQLEQFSSQSNMPRGIDTIDSNKDSFMLALTAHKHSHSRSLRSEQLVRRLKENSRSQMRSREEMSLPEKARAILVKAVRQTTFASSRESKPEPEKPEMPSCIKETAGGQDECLKMFEIPKRKAPSTKQILPQIP